MLKVDYIRQVVVIVTGGVPTGLEVHFMPLFMFCGRILLHSSVSTNLFNPKRHEVDLWKVKVSIKLLWNIDPLADIILPRIHFVPFLGQGGSCIIRYIIYLAHLHEFSPHGIALGLLLLLNYPSRKLSLKMWQQCKTSSSKFNVALLCHLHWTYVRNSDNAHMHWIEWLNMECWAGHPPWRIWVPTPCRYRLMYFISVAFH